MDLLQNFFTAAWSIVGNDVTNAILHFFDSLQLPRIINATALALIPKCAGASKITDYRSISCCTTIYKCISKLLTMRLKQVLPTIISHNQSAFVPKRRIGDNIMLAQSICRDYHREAGVPRCAIKLDIQKAFDSLNWDFLFGAMSRMGFPTVFLNWVKKCVSSAMISVKVNGSLEGFFESKSGLRQGDPLSPFLFVIGMEVLTAYLSHDLENDPNFTFHWHTQEIKLSHLAFADDLLLFCKGDTHSISALLTSVARFSEISNLRPNIAKSHCFFCNVPQQVKDDTLSISGFQQGTLPIKYLGLPLITSRLKASDCVELTHKICSRIDSWSTKLLKHSSRLLLVNSVLFSIQGYWASYLFLPKAVLYKLQSLFVKFLWGGSVNNNCYHKVSWKDCCLPKTEGGLGIRSLVEWNKAAIFFRFGESPNQRQTRYGFYGFTSAFSKTSLSGLLIFQEVAPGV